MIEMESVSEKTIGTPLGNLQQILWYPQGIKLENIWTQQEPKANIGISIQMGSLHLLAAAIYTDIYIYIYEKCIRVYNVFIHISMLEHTHICQPEYGVGLKNYPYEVPTTTIEWQTQRVQACEGCSIDVPNVATFLSHLNFRKAAWILLYYFSKEL